MVFQSLQWASRWERKILCSWADHLPKLVGLEEDLGKFPLKGLRAISRIEFNY